MSNYDMCVGGGGVVVKKPFYIMWQLLECMLKIIDINKHTFFLTFTQIVKAVISHETALKAQAKKMNVESLRSNAVSKFSKINSYICSKN